MIYNRLISAFGMSCDYYLALGAQPLLLAGALDIAETSKASL